MLRRQLGEAIRSARNLKGLTQESVAKSAGIARTSLSNIEKGNQGISVETLYSIASALSMEPADLLPKRTDLLNADASSKLPDSVDTKNWLAGILSKQ